MKPQEIIRKKRDGETLTKAEITAFISGVTTGGWADYQISAFLMACFTRGLNADETAFLTFEMLHSGQILDFSDIDAPIADKHSTGGVGDKTSLIIAPLAAACGVAVPMISGRGLGHTGGTLDKLESIAGYNVNLSLDEFKKVVKKCGFAMTGQTAEIAPADKKLYALRDATATVEYIPLIVASIMSKKLAENLDALVLDVKTGSGAFMDSLEKALELADAMIAVGTQNNVRTAAVISDMNQPLGKFVGNALEVYECVKILRDESDNDFADTRELSIELTARMLVQTAIANDIDSAKKLCESKLRDGSALEKLRDNIKLQNGSPNICDDPQSLINEKLLRVEIKAPASGFVTAIATKSIGETVSGIGGGRNKITDKIDFAVGYQCRARIGDFVRENDALGTLLCRSENQADIGRRFLSEAYQISAEEPQQTPLIIKTFS